MCRILPRLPATTFRLRSSSLEGLGCSNRQTPTTSPRPRDGAAGVSVLGAELAMLSIGVSNTQAPKVMNVILDAVKEREVVSAARPIGLRNLANNSCHNAVSQAAGAPSPSGVMSRNEAGEVQVTRTCMRCGLSTVASQPATCISVTLPWMGTATREEVVKTLSCPCAPGRTVHHSIRRQIKALLAVMEPEAVGVFDPMDWDISQSSVEMMEEDVESPAPEVTSQWSLMSRRADCVPFLEVDGQHYGQLSDPMDVDETEAEADPMDVEMAADMEVAADVDAAETTEESVSRGSIGHGSGGGNVYGSIRGGRVRFHCRRRSSDSGSCGSSSS